MHSWLKFIYTLLTVLYHCYFPHVADATYEATGKHTYLPMTIMSVLFGVVALIFIACYRQLAPRSLKHEQSDEIKDEATIALIEYKGKFIHVMMSLGLVSCKSFSCN